MEKLSFSGELEVFADETPDSFSDNRKKKKKARRGASKKKRSEVEIAKEKYDRGEGNSLKGIRSQKLRKKLKDVESMAKEQVEAASHAEILLPETAGYLEAEGMEETWRFTQDELKEHVDDRTSEKMFNLDLEKFGPYKMSFTRNGRHLLLGGRKGHVAQMEWTTFKLRHEMHLRETIRDVTFLHDESMYAVAQKKYLYIYDSSGLELHCMRDHVDVNVMQFLPYHYLLATAGKSGMLKYLDTSRGERVAEHKTRLGETKCMAQNPRNAVLHLGHTNGNVTLWTPNSNTAVVKMLCHRAPVLDLDIDIGGNYMVTSGMDGQMKVWDVRTYKELYSYFTVQPASSVSMSHSGMVALGCGPHIQIWKDAFRSKQKSPYMRQTLHGKTIEQTQFVPFEDVLGIAHTGGYSSIVVPGAGEANFDSFEANPYQTTKQRREKTVVSLLEKLQPDMISLDANRFGLMNQNSKSLFDSSRRAVRDAEKEKEIDTERKRARGKNRSSKRWKRKRKNVVDTALVERQEKIQHKNKLWEADKKKQEREASGLSNSALDRFI